MEWNTDPIPLDGSVVYIRVAQPFRFKLYSPKSQQFKAGEKGRWQMMTEYGGWENCSHPLGNEWRRDLLP